MLTERNSPLARAPDTFLLVVDVQDPLLQVMHESEPLLKNVHILLEAARVLGLPLFATEQYPERLGPTAEPIRAAWGDVTPIGKMEFSAWPSVRMAVKATGRRTAVVCGVEAHICVQQTAQDLLAAGYRVHIPADAVASRTPANRDLGLRKIEWSGAVLTSTEGLVYELLERAGTPEFKAMLPWLK